MSSIILKLKPWLPQAVFVLLRNAFWKNFWRSELEIQKNQLGEKAARSLVDSERSILIENICDAYPFSSILEVGCAFGQNFHILSKIFPAVEMLGIDKDLDRVNGGQAYLQEMGYHNARLQQLLAEDLGNISTKSHDIVFAAASLLYIPETEIENVVNHMKRIAKKRVIILEQQSDGSTVQGKLVENGKDLPYWERNYLQLVKEIFPGSNIETRNILNPLWVTEKWQSLGQLMIIDI